VSSEHRGVLARMIAFNGLILLLASILVGTHILAFFGISLPVVQVAGGLVLMVTGWKLLQSEDDGGESESANSPCDDIDYRRKAFYPLTLPLTVGPGSISVAITLGANRHEGEQWSWGLLAGIVVGATAIAVAIYLSYRFADKLASALGETAMNVFIRLSSFILMCIGVQIAWNGVKALLHEVVR